jgi:hypothetical protein
MATSLKVSERQFMDQVMKLARLYRWKVYHTYDSRRSQPGYPDLTLCRVTRQVDGTVTARLIYAELKTNKGRLSLQQKEWLGALGSVPNVEAYCWRPSDWEEIVSILRTK